MDNIQVGIRMRPLLARERDGAKWILQGKNAIVPTTPGCAGFEFDHVFGEGSSTSDIYNTITQPIVYSVMQGVNGTVFAYGQTSSGKTFTMMGTGEQPGVIPLAVKEVFEYIEEHIELEFIVRVSYLQIYKEGICDLLDPTFTDLKIREDRNNVKVHGLKEYVVTNIREVSSVIHVGNINRTTGETKMNEHSSRSHAVLSLVVESRRKDGEDSTVKVASLNLVDLAGSEKLLATGAVGKRAQEGISINKSLFTLKQVISKLAEGNHSVHVPYRDSKLTFILKPSLGGNAKTAIICTVTPAEFPETESTLYFALCAMKVKNRPTVNEVVGGEEALKKKLKQLEKENSTLRDKLSSSENSLTEEMKRELLDQMDEKRSKQRELEDKIHSLQEIIIKSRRPDIAPAASSVSRSKYNRRMTICPALLARNMGSPLLIRQPPPTKPRHSMSPTITPDIVNRAISRVKASERARTSKPSFKSDDVEEEGEGEEGGENWESMFNASGFERELDHDMALRCQTMSRDTETMRRRPLACGLNDPRHHHHLEEEEEEEEEGVTPFVARVSVRDLERRRTMAKCVTFVMDTPASSVSTPDQSGTWTDTKKMVVVDEVSTVATQTMDTRSHECMVETATQTEPVEEEKEEEEEGGGEEKRELKEEEEAMDTAVQATDAATQTDPPPPPPPSPPRLPRPVVISSPRKAPPPPPPLAAAVVLVSDDLNSSTCFCSHKCTLRTNLDEQLIFNEDELVILKEESEMNLVELNQTRLDLQEERVKCNNLNDQLEKAKSNIKDLEIASSAQEDYLTKMCDQSKMATQQQMELKETCSHLQLALSEREHELERFREKEAEELMRVRKEMEDELERMRKEKEEAVKKMREEMQKDEERSRDEKEKELERLRMELEEVERLRSEKEKELNDLMEQQNKKLREELEEVKQKYQTEMADERQRFWQELEEEKKRFQIERENEEKKVKEVIETEGKTLREQWEKEEEKLREGMEEERKKFSEEMEKEKERLRVEVEEELKQDRELEIQRLRDEVEEEKDQLRQEKEKLMAECEPLQKKSVEMKDEEEKDNVEVEEEEKLEKEKMVEDFEALLKKNDQLNVDIDEWKEKEEGWRRERGGWVDEKKKWERDREEWAEANEMWSEEKQNWMEGWKEEREERDREREMWETQRGDWEKERAEMVAGACLLREQLQSLQSELEKLPSSKRLCLEPPSSSPSPVEEHQLTTALLDKVKELEEEKEKEIVQFQTTYQQKVRELQKAQEMICYLQEQLETTPTNPQTTPTSEEDLKRAKEEMTKKEREIESLSSQISLLSQELSSTKLMAQSKMEALEWNEDKKRELENELRTLNEQYSLSQSSLQVKAVENEQMLNQLDEMEREKETGRIEKERSEEERQGLVIQLEKMEGEMERLREEVATQLDIVSTQTREMEKEGAMATEREREMKSLSSHLSNELAVTKQLLQTKTEDLERNEDRMTELENQFQNRTQAEEEEMTKKEREIESLSSQISLLSQELSSTKLMAQSKTGELERSEGRLNQVETELQSLTQQMKQIQSALETKMSECELLEEKVEERRNKEQEVMAQFHSELEEKDREWQEKMEALKQKAEEEMEAKQNEFDENIVEAIVDVQTKHEKDVEHLNAECLQLHDNLLIKKAQCLRLEKNVIELQTAVESLTEKLQQNEEERMTEVNVERHELQERNKVLEDTVVSLTVQTNSLQTKLTQLQQKPSPTPIALAEAAFKLKDLQKENNELKEKMKTLMTTSSSRTTLAGALQSGDSPGSAALCRVRGELTKIEREKEKLEARVTKLKNSLRESKDLYAEEQKDMKRYREERNIFREKYRGLREWFVETTGHKPVIDQEGHIVQPDTVKSLPPPPPPAKPAAAHLPSNQHPQPSSSSSSQPPPPPSYYNSKRPHLQPSTSSHFNPLTSSSSTTTSSSQSTLTPKNNPRRSIFSYVPPPKTSKPADTASVLPPTMDTRENCVPPTTTGGGGGEMKNNIGEKMWDMTLIDPNALTGGGSVAPPTATPTFQPMHDTKNCKQQ